MAGRPAGSPNKDKPFRDALRMELAAAGENHKALREIARALVEMAKERDIQAIKEIADRTDGKVAQALVGDSEYDPIQVSEIKIKLIAPKPEDGA